MQLLSAQEEIWRVWQRLLHHRKLPHALLLIDKPAISAALPLATALAAYMHCTERAHKNSPCGACFSCKQSQLYTHPSIRYIFPVASVQKEKLPISASFMREWQQFMADHPFPKESAWFHFLQLENKQGNISAKECAQIAEAVRLKNNDEGGMVFIIWLAEYLRNEANKLLKIIEEPGEGIYFILITQREEALLPTLRSRTQRYALRPFTNEHISAYLQHLGASPSLADQLSVQATGDINAAIALYKEEVPVFFPLLKLFLNACFTQKSAYTWDMIKEGGGMNREEVKSFFDYASHIYAQALRAPYLSETRASQNAEITAVIQKIAQILSTAQIIRSLSLLAKHRYYAERNANIKLLLHHLILSLQHIRYRQGTLSIFADNAVSFK